MPYYRRKKAGYTKRRRYIRRGKSGYAKRRRTGKRYSQAQIHTFKRVFIDQITTGGTGSNISTVYTVSLNDLDDYTDFTNLFDQYRIVKLVLRFEPLIDYIGEDDDDGDVPAPVIVYSALDKNDYGTVNIAAINQYQNVCRKQVPSDDATFTWSFRPAVAFNSVDNTGNPLRNTRISPWLSCTNDIAPHGYVKVVSSNNPNTNTEIKINVYGTVYMQFKNVK